MYYEICVNASVSPGKIQQNWIILFCGGIICISKSSIDTDMFKMPTNCGVPLCTRKEKRDEDTGEIIHFFCFPDDENTRKLWLHAIRRDVGPYFSITHGTRVCSRHFKSEDLRKTPNKTFLRPGAVPSIFTWKRSSPRKRPPPTYRSEPHLFPKKSKKDKDNVPKTDSTNLQRKKIETAPSASTSHDPKTEKLSVKSQERTEVAAPTESESGSEMSEIVNKDSFIRELQDRLDEALSNKEKLEEKVSQLMEKSTKLEGRLFCFENISNNDSLIMFLHRISKFENADGFV